MKKLISSSVFNNVFDSVALAKELKTGIEISRLPENLSLSKQFDDIKKTLRRAVENFDGIKTMHGLFCDLNVVSTDEEIREVSIKRYFQSLEIANEIGASVLLFHTNKKSSKHLGSQKKFKIKIQDFWCHFIEEVEKTNLTVVLENVHEDSPEFIFDILQKVNSPKLKASIDVGHINVYSEIDVENWILKMKDSLIHMHFHNNFGNDDEHNCLTRGTLDFYKIVKCLKNNNLSPLIVFEIFEKQALLESIDIFDRLYEKGDLT